MSPKIATDYAAQICLQIPIVEAGLEALRESTRQTVNDGARLGGLVDEGRRQHKENLWTWLSALPVQARAFTIRFALRAHRAKLRSPELEDASQLSFALAAPSAETASETDSRPAPQARDESGFSEILKLAGRLASLVAKQQHAAPFPRWRPVTRLAVQMALLPLANAHRELSKLSAR